MNHVIFDGEFSFFLSPLYLSFSRPSTHSIDFKFSKLRSSCEDHFTEDL